MSYSDVEDRVRFDDAIRATDAIARGKVAQAVIDHEFHARGFDSLSTLHRNALRFAMGEEIDRETLRIADTLVLREPEGFAFYAVYPELYAMAARRLPASSRRLVIGVRTIGTTLGAVVAKESHAADFVTLRPIGHPFARRLAIDDALRAHILSFDDFAIVDEGPGLSGSTFGCIADFLEDAGVSRDRIVFLPSHDGAPGPQASSRHRERWSHATRIVEPFESLLPSIVREAQSFIGEVHETIDIGGGLWRAHVAFDERPPSTLNREPRKYLLRTRDAQWLLKFSGLGGIANTKLAKSQRVGVPAVGVANGFLVSEWMNARIVDLQRDRAALLRSVQTHLDACDEIDNRMHRWEWIATADGRVIKCDALDHSRWHDGVRCDDPRSWDAAGASVELGIELATSHRDAYIDAQLAWCEQMLSESMGESERTLWVRERARYAERRRPVGWPGGVPAAV